MLLSVNHLSLSLQTIELTLQLPEQTVRVVLLLTGNLRLPKLFSQCVSVRLSRADVCDSLTLTH